MTGFGFGESTINGITAKVEIRSVNNRFLEITARLPRSLSLKENELREIIKKQVSRGKINVNITIEHSLSKEALPLKLNLNAASTYAALLTDLKNKLNLKDEITLNHILKFSEVLEVEETIPMDEEEWNVSLLALEIALKELMLMKTNEGKVLAKDLSDRNEILESTIDIVESISNNQIPIVKEQLQSRISELLSSPTAINNERLEMEIALYADKLDITEECVRFRSHTTYLRSLLDGKESAGRTMSFLLQEINREVNTIGSKANNAPISHYVVQMKEELEKIREQLQNVE